MQASSIIEVELIVAKIINFIYEQKHPKVFHRWTFEDIHDSIFDAFINQSLLYHFNIYDNVDGFICGVRDEKKKNFHVVCMCSIDKDMFKNFLKKLYLMYPDYTFTATRKFKQVKYNTKQFLTKL